MEERTRALPQNVTNAPEGALTPNLENVEVTVKEQLHYSRKLSGQILSMKTIKSNNSKPTMLIVMVLVHCTSPQ